MRTKDPFRDGAEDMAQEFVRLAKERSDEFEAAEAEESEEETA